MDDGEELELEDLLELEGELREPELIGPVALALLSGYAPFSASMRALLEGAVREATDVQGLGLELEILEAIDGFERIPESRVIMECARRAGIPYSEARHRWRDPEDLAAEIAWNALQSAEALKACPSCGIDPDDVIDPETKRPLRNGRWKIVPHSCYVEEILRKLRDGREEHEMDLDWRIVPRGPGDPFVEEHDGGRPDRPSRT